MSDFIVSNWFENRAKLNIQLFSVEHIDFEIMALTDDLIDDIKCCDSYAEMIELAANSGISYNRKRVVDDPELAKDIDMLWSLDEMSVESDPSIRWIVGLEICDISGLSDLLDETYATEQEKDTRAAEAKEYLEGDALPDSSLTLGQLESDAAEYVAA
tara:strand:+ start:1331 stop:1804 length:474 start_codon:yes stop_codon:yes gene_type:complete